MLLLKPLNVLPIAGAFMKTSLIALVLCSAMACKTTEAASTPSSNYDGFVHEKGSGGKALPQKAADAVPKASDVLPSGKGDESLLKWRVGRWSLVHGLEGANEKMDKPGTVACDVTAATVTKELGAERLSVLKGAIAELYKIKDQRQSNPIFRGLENSRELVARFNDEEFLIEKMFQSREVIAPTAAAVVGRDIPKASAGEAALEIIMAVAIDPKICAHIPN